MAGKVQHEIPQLYQRGFLIPNTGDAERIFVFRRGGQVYASNINRSGAEGYFYSKPSEDGSRTLDDEITDYEKDRLDGLVHELRGLSVGAIADPSTAAEVIAHLTTRNAHLRGTFTEGFTTVARSAFSAFTDQGNLKRLLGLEETRVTQVFRDHMGKALANEPLITSLGIPQDLLEKLAFTHTREGFGPFFDQFRPTLEAQLKRVTIEANDYAREGHRRALSSGPVPARRVAQLSDFRWEVVASGTDLILPDCVALAVQHSGEVHPLMMVDTNTIQSVVLPLTSRTLLVGSPSGAGTFDAGRLNADAAACSHSYFLCASQSSDLQELVGLIGSRSVKLIESAIQSGVRDYLPHETPPASVEPSLDPPPAISVRLNFEGSFEEGQLQQIADAVSAVLAEASWTVPLEGLDGITIADDYVGALAKLDRGKLGVGVPKTRQDEEAFGVAQCPAVLRGDTLKSHIVLHGGLARNLLSDFPEYKAYAEYAIANQLAQAGITQIFDEALPGVILSRVDGLDGLLQPGSFPAWNNYFASRAAASFGYEGRLSEVAGLCVLGLREFFQTALEARAAYREHGDMDRLLEEILPRIAFFLEHAADLLGHADALEADVATAAPEFMAALDTHGLRAWYWDFQRDLAYLWDKRGNWESYDEFLGLNRHVERLLWLIPMLPITKPDGQIWIEVPYTQEEVATWEAEAMAQQATTPADIQER